MMHLSASSHSSSCLEWRVPPSKCRLLANRAALYIRYSRRHTVAAAAASTGQQQEQAAVVVPIPGSKEEAVSSAVSALMGQLKWLIGGGAGKKAKRVKKGFAGSSSSSNAAVRTRFSIELPLPSDSPAESAAFVGELLKQLPAAATAGVVVVCASETTAAAVAAAGVVRGGSSSVMSLQSACRSAGRLEGPLLLVEPTTADVALVDQLLSEVWACGPPWALVVNPTWFSGLPPEYQGVVDSWEVVYSLMITATQGLMRTEGAVLRHLAPGSSSSSSSPWRVLLKDRRSDQFVQVGQMQHRPTQSDLELTFINAKAAQSPLTSLVKGVKGLFDKQQQQQQ